MNEPKRPKSRSTRGNWIDRYAIISPVLLFLFANWFGYELFGNSNVRVIASLLLLLVTVLSGSVASTVAAMRKALPWSLLYWLAAVIHVLVFIYFWSPAWLVLKWAVEKYGG